MLDPTVGARSRASMFANVRLLGWEVQLHEEPGDGGGVPRRRGCRSQQPPNCLAHQFPRETFRPTLDESGRGDRRGHGRRRLFQDSRNVALQSAVAVPVGGRLHGQLSQAVVDGGPEFVVRAGEEVVLDRATPLQEFRQEIAQEVIRFKAGRPARHP